MKKALGAFLSIVILACVSSAAAANDSVMGGVAGNLQPVDNADIRLMDEEVHIVVHEQFAEASVNFVFDNTGDPQWITLGFPFAIPTDDMESYSGAQPAAFRAFAGGEPLDVEFQRSEGAVHDTGFWLHDVYFETGVTPVRVEYMMSPSSSSGWAPEALELPPNVALEDTYRSQYTYWLHTGAGWANTIRSALVRVTISPDFSGFGEEFGMAEVLSWRDPIGDDPMREAHRIAGDPEGSRSYRWFFEEFEPDVVADDQYIYDIAFPFFTAWANADGTPRFPQATDASSYLALGDHQYPAHQVADGIPRTAWAEGVDGSGEGEWVLVEFPEEREVREIRVIPGYAKTQELFYKYNRPKTLLIEYSTGASQSIELKDEPTLQRFFSNAVGNFAAEWARVTIVDVYPGTTRDETYLTEVAFGAQAAPPLDNPDLDISAGLGDPVMFPIIDPADVPTQTSGIRVDKTRSVEETSATGGATPDDGVAWPAALAFAFGAVLGIGVTYALMRRRSGSSLPAAS